MNHVILLFNYKIILIFNNTKLVWGLDYFRTEPVTFGTVLNDGPNGYDNDGDSWFTGNDNIDNDRDSDDFSDWGIDGIGPYLTDEYGGLIIDSCSRKFVEIIVNSQAENALMIQNMIYGLLMKIMMVSGQQITNIILFYLILIILDQIKVREMESQILVNLVSIMLAL